MTFVIARINNKKIVWNPLKSLFTIIILFYLCILIYVLLTLTAVQSQGGGGYYSELIVNKGDSLWTIARHHFPNQDPRLIVSQLREVNKLKDPTIYPGQILEIPK